MPTQMAGSCDQKRRRIRGKESEKNDGWKEKEGKTEKEMGGRYQGGGGTGSSKVEDDGPQRRPPVELGKARRRRRCWRKAMATYTKSTIEERKK